MSAGVREGLEWTVFDTPVILAEVTAPTIVEDNTLKIYAKDKSGVSNLYFKDDAEVEHDLDTTGMVTGSGAAGQVAFWTGATVLSGENDLFWDSTNNRLGIGTNAPAFQLHVKKVGASASVRFETDTVASYATLSLLSGAKDWQLSHSSNDGFIALYENGSSPRFKILNGGAIEMLNGPLTIGGASPLNFALHILRSTSDFIALNVSGNNQLSGIGCGQDLTALGAGEQFIQQAYINTGSGDTSFIFLSDSGVLRVGGFAFGGLSLATEAVGAAIRFLTSQTALGDCYDFTKERFRIGSVGQWGIGGSATATYNTANFGAAGNVMISGGPSAAASWFSRLVLSGDNMILGGGATASEFRFLEPSGSGSNYTAFKAQAQASDLTYTLPAAGPTSNNQVLASTVSGILSWVSVVLVINGEYWANRYFASRYFANRYFG